METVVVSIKGMMAAEEEIATVVLTVEALTEVQERCIKPPAQNANKNVKFLLNQQKANQYIAENVSRNADINLIILGIILLCYFSYFFCI